MNKEQIIKLMSKIKSYYPNFKLNDIATKEWQKELEKYDEYDVLNSLENYVNRGSDYYPKLNQLTYHLKTIEEKENTDLNKIYVDCPLCKRTIKYINFNKHHDKCLLIKSMIKLDNTLGNYEELNKYDYATLRQVYDKTYPIDTEKLKKYIN